MVIPWATAKPEIKLRTSSLIRLHPQSTNIQIKVAGHYVNSFLATTEAKKHGADDALMLDHQGNVAETSVANIFLISGANIITPCAKNIFAGITRDSVIKLCKFAGSTVAESEVSYEMARASEGIFIAGTATEVMPVTDLDGQPLIVSRFVQRCRDLYALAVKGEIQEFQHWLTFVD